MDVTLPQGLSLITEPLPGIAIATKACHGRIYFHGAHVAEWTPNGALPVLWMSHHSVFAGDAPIRGGVPICLPWFGPGRDGKTQPGHGFARLASWRLNAATVDGLGVADLEFELPSDGVQHLPGGAQWPADAQVKLLVTMGSHLMLTLRVQAGADGLDIEEALHSYLSVGEVTRISVEGLAEASYFDKVHDLQTRQRGGLDITEETDRVYRTDGTVRVVDPTMDRIIVVAKQNSANTIVWNPWAAKSAAMPDFGRDEWREMICVEAGNVGSQARQLSAGEVHELIQTIALESLD